MYSQALPKARRLHRRYSGKEVIASTGALDEIAWQTSPYGSLSIAQEVARKDGKIAQ